MGWTQAELAQRADVARADISRIENGRLDAWWSTIQRISEALESSNREPTRSLAKRSSWSSSAEIDGKQDLGAEGTDLVDRRHRFVILRHATDDDAEALHSFDVGDTSFPWFAEVAEIVAGLLGWRSDPAATDEDRQVVSRARR